MTLSLPLPLRLLHNDNSPPQRFPGSSARRLLGPVSQLHPESIGLPRSPANFLLKRPRLFVSPSCFFFAPRVRLASPAPLALIVQLLVQLLFLERIPGAGRGKERIGTFSLSHKKKSKNVSRRRYDGGEVVVVGVRAYSFVACFTLLIIGHASLSRQSTVHTPNRDTSNIWALITFFSCYYTKTFCLSLPVSPFVATIYLLG